jgi:thiol-disulfide isomerase/thioredoxin
LCASRQADQWVVQKCPRRVPRVLQLRTFAQWKEVSHRKGTVLLQIGRHNCPACRHMSSVLEQLSEEVPFQRVLFVSTDTEDCDAETKAQCHRLLQQTKVIPLLLLRQDGKTFMVWHGQQSSRLLHNALRQLL